MVPDLGCIVEDAAFCLADHRFEGGLLEGGSRKQVIEVVYICKMMLAVMELKSLGAQMRSEVASCILQWGEFEFHDLVRLFGITRKYNNKSVVPSNQISQKYPLRQQLNHALLMRNGEELPDGLPSLLSQREAKVIYIQFDMFAGYLLFSFAGMAPDECS